MCGWPSGAPSVMLGRNRAQQVRPQEDQLLRARKSVPEMPGGVTSVPGEATRQMCQLQPEAPGEPRQRDGLSAPGSDGISKSMGNSSFESWELGPEAGVWAQRASQSRDTAGGLGHSEGDPVTTVTRGWGHPLLTCVPHKELQAGCNPWPLFGD